MPWNELERRTSEGQGPNRWLLLAVIASAAVAHAAPTRPECGTHTPSDVHMHQHNMAVMEHRFTRGRRQLITEPNLLIPVRIIAFTLADGTGSISTAVALEQVEKLNTGFNGTEGVTAVNVKIRFFLDSLQNIVNPTFYSSPNANEIRIKTTYATDTNRFVYFFVANLEESILGFATFPTSRNAGSPDWSMFLTRFSLPGNRFSSYNGGTATHEVGHLFGLYHTFQGGCTAQNDGVADTPACQKTFSCSPGDTCPTQPGRDLAINFMSYSDDDCMNSFTQGQAERMRESLRVFRPDSVSVWAALAAGTPVSFPPTPQPPATTTPLPISQVVASATPIACSQTIVGNTETTPSDVVGGPSLDDLFRLDLATPTTVTLDTCQSSFDTVIAVFSDDGLRTGGGVIGLNDDGDCPTDRLHSTLILQLDAGRYFIAVEGYDASQSGPYRLRAQCTSTGTTTAIPTGGATQSFSTVIANAPMVTCGSVTPGSNVGGSSFVGQRSPEAYYKLNIPAGPNQAINLSTCGSDFDTVLHLFDANGLTPSSASVVTNDDHGNFCSAAAHVYHSAIIVPVLTPGQYVIAVEGYGGASGSFSLRTTCLSAAAGATAPPTVDRATVQPPSASTTLPSVAISSTPISCRQSVVGDTTTGNAVIGNDSPEIVYRLAFAGGTLTVNTCGSQFDTYLRLISAAGLATQGFPSVQINDDHSNIPGCTGQFDSHISMTLPAGVYYIVVEGYNLAAGQFTLNVLCSIPTIPAVQLPAGVTISGGVVVCGSAVEGDTFGNTGMSGSPEASYLLDMTSASEGTVVILSTCGATFTSTLRIFTLDGTPVERYFGDGDGGRCSNFGRNSGPLDSTATLAVDPGYYIVMVQGRNLESGQFSLTVDCGIDLVSSATRLSCGDTISGESSDGTTQYGAPSPEKVFVVSINPGPLEISTCGSDFDTTLTLADENSLRSPGQYEPIAFNDDSPCSDGGTFQSDITGNVLEEGLYYIIVEGYDRESGNFVLNINCVPGPTFSPTAAPTLNTNIFQQVSDEGSDGASTALIVVGVLVLLLALGVFAFFVWKRKQKSERVVVVSDSVPNKAAMRPITMSKTAGLEINNELYEPSATAASPAGDLYRAEYDCTGDSRDDLTFKKDDIITVTQKNDDGWWYGLSDGKEGFFPSSYVLPCSSRLGSPTPVYKTQASSPAVSNTYDEVSFADEGDRYMNTAQMKAPTPVPRKVQRSTPPTRPATQPPMRQIPTRPPPTRTGTRNGGLKTGTAISSHTATRSGELSFSAGDVITQLAPVDVHGIAKGMLSTGTVGTFAIAKLG